MLQPDQIFTAVQFDSSALTYAYEWKLPSSLFSQQLVEEAKALVSPLADFMQPLGPDNDYEKKWFCTPFEKICTTTLFWNLQTAAVAVAHSRAIRFF